MLSNVLNFKSISRFFIDICNRESCLIKETISLTLLERLRKKLKILYYMGNFCKKIKRCIQFEK